MKTHITKDEVLQRTWLSVAILNTLQPEHFHPELTGFDIELTINGIPCDFRKVIAMMGDQFEIAVQSEAARRLTGLVVEKSHAIQRRLCEVEQELEREARRQFPEAYPGDD